MQEGGRKIRRGTRRRLVEPEECRQARHVARRTYRRGVFCEHPEDDLRSQEQRDMPRSRQDGEVRYQVRFEDERLEARDTDRKSDIAPLQVRAHDVAEPQTVSL